MTERVECYDKPNQDGEVIGNQLESEKFNKNLTDASAGKKISNLLKRPKQRQSISA